MTATELPLDELLRLAEEKICLGEQLISDLKAFESIDGVQKIQRRINQEKKFLQKATKNKTIKTNNLLCSNLTYFRLLVQAIQRSIGLKIVDYSVPNFDRTSPLRVDIISENGSTWMKVIARNPKSITEAVEGRASYGAKSILDQAEEFVEAAALNPHLFASPRVVFLFSNRIDAELEAELREIGVHVAFLQADDATPTTLMENNNEPPIRLLNIDVTTMIAMVSQLTNGSASANFGNRLLNEQAEWERRRPILLVLERILDGKELICCETAVKAFRGIVELLAGPKEKARSEEFLARLKILPDVERIPREFENLQLTAKVKERSLKIFAFGVEHRAITVTSNEGFCRSAKMQGIEIPVVMHEARCLTELKEMEASSGNSKLLK